MNRFDENENGKQFAGFYDADDKPVFEGDRYTESDSYCGLFSRTTTFEIVWHKTGFCEKVIEADNGLADTFNHETIMSHGLTAEQEELLRNHPGYELGMYKVGSMYGISLCDGGDKVQWRKSCTGN